MSWQQASGIEWCPEHDGVKLEGEHDEHCDQAQRHHSDADPCVTVSLFFEVTA